MRYRPKARLHFKVVREKGADEGGEHSWCTIAKIAQVREIAPNLVTNMALGHFPPPAPVKFFITLFHCFALSHSLSQLASLLNFDHKEHHRALAGNSNDV